MYKIAIKLNFLLLIFILIPSGVLYSQTDEDLNSTGKVQAVVSDLPSTMYVGATYNVTVTITNTGKKTWSSETLSSAVKGSFKIAKVNTEPWKLEPGESTSTNYLVTAPSKTGNYRLKVIIYNSGKIIGQKTKRIEVMTTSMR